MQGRESWRWGAQGRAVGLEGWEVAGVGGGGVTALPLAETLWLAGARTAQPSLRLADHEHG